MRVFILLWAIVLGAAGLLRERWGIITDMDPDLPMRPSVSMHRY